MSLKTNQIFYSTGCIKGTLEERINSWRLQGKTNIEISYPIYDDKTFEKLHKIKETYGLRFILHNYIPVNEYQFVFNLGSLEDSIRHRSQEIALRAIKETAMLGEKFYSFHAPFQFDPKITTLGNTLDLSELYDAQKVINAFKGSLDVLCKEAEKYKVLLLIENNVITKNNLKIFGQDPLLFTGLSYNNDFCQIADTYNIYFLLDIGHLNVSKNTLGFDIDEFMDIYKPRIKGLHLSSNDSKKDQNLMPSNEFISLFGEFITLEYATYEVTMKSFLLGKN